MTESLKVSTRFRSADREQAISFRRQVLVKETVESIETIENGYAGARVQIAGFAFEVISCPPPETPLFPKFLRGK